MEDFEDSCSDTKPNFSQHYHSNCCDFFVLAIEQTCASCQLMFPRLTRGQRAARCNWQHR
eukprot:4339262-Amphidinium_carterae.1